MEKLVVLFAIRTLITTAFFLIAGLVLLWAHFYFQDQFGSVYEDWNSSRLIMLFAAAIVYLFLTILSSAWLYVLMVFQSGNDEESPKFANRLVSAPNFNVKITTKYTDFRSAK